MKSGVIGTICSGSGIQKDKCSELNLLHTLHMRRDRGPEVSASTRRHRLRKTERLFSGTAKKKKEASEWEGEGAFGESFSWPEMKPHDDGKT